MAFETTRIYSTDHSLLLTWLQQHAVPAYFDRVEADTTTASTIRCYVGDTVLLEASIGANSKGTNSIVTITTARGLTKNVSPNTTIAGYYFNYAAKCAGGIALTTGTDTPDTVRPLVVITKDSAGNTAIVTGGKLDTNGYYNGCSATTAADTVILDQDLAPLTAQATTVVPFVCGNAPGEARHTPNVVYFPTRQYLSTGEIVINGTLYQSNGYWALRDAEGGAV